MLLLMFQLFAYNLLTGACYAVRHKAGYGLDISELVLSSGFLLNGYALISNRLQLHNCILCLDALIISVIRTVVYVL